LSMANVVCEGWRICAHTDTDAVRQPQLQKDTRTEPAGKRLAS
jgi:hypothetical protein